MSYGYEEAKRRLRTILQQLGPRLGLTPRLIDLAVDCAQIRFLDAGETIFMPQEAHDFSYVLIDGLVRVESLDHRRQPTTLQLVGKGRLFGVAWVPKRRRRELRAVAQTAATTALITQQVIAEVFAELQDRTGIMSYAWRALSALVVHKNEARSLEAHDRVLHALAGIATGFGRADDGHVGLTIPLTSEDLASLVGAAPGTIRHVVADLLRGGRLARDTDGRFVLPSPAGAANPDHAPPPRYEGFAAPWARQALGDLVGRCGHMGLNARAMELIRQRAELFEVPAGGLLLPDGYGEAVAFVVRGSAWLEGVGSSGDPFAIELVAPGRFVRLPTEAASRGPRMRGRAHEDCVVGVLTVALMREVIGVLSVEGGLTLLDVTCRGLSRLVCDAATAPGRGVPCRLLGTLGFIAHDFPGRAEGGLLLKLRLTHEDLGRLVDADRASVTHAVDTLTADGWVERVAPQRYVLRDFPPGAAPTPAKCRYCEVEPAPRQSSAQTPHGGPTT